MNTRKPTKREAKLAQDGMVWHGVYNPWVYIGDEFRWTKREASKCRDLWMPGDVWLPVGALPEPTQPTTKKGRKA